MNTLGRMLRVKQYKEISVFEKKRWGKPTAHQNGVNIAPSH